MKKLLVLLIVAVSFNACYKTADRKVSYIEKIPIYQFTTEKEAEEGLKQGTPTELTSFGNIYIYQNYLLINERGQGIHIYENSNPSAPVQISFMNIPGNFDMAIQNNQLYVDSYDDLLTLDISDINSIRLIERVDNVFPNSHPSLNGVIIGYKDSLIEYEERIGLDIGGQNDETSNIQTLAFAGANQTGVGGSFARFTITNNHLFAIDRNRLNTFDLSNSQQLVKTSVIDVPSFEIETVFPYQQHLFIGSADGVVIYDISNPASPVFTSNFTHARACDPVYVEDDVAFVTLRSNTANWCTGSTDQLDIIDVSAIDRPLLTNTYPMIGPHGVGVDGNMLFVCEANSGLKIYSFQKQFENNRLKSVDLSLIEWNKSIFAYDVIPNNGVLIVVGENDLNQYDYSDPNNITLLSSLK